MEISQIYNPSNNDFIDLVPFVYADGSNNLPLALRDTPEQNYLDPRIRAFFLILMAIAYVVIFLSALWVFIYRSHSVVVASQPMFLYSLCFGSAVTTINMWLYGNDESYGWDETMLDASCVASIWISSIGNLILYCALFTKVSHGSPASWMEVHLYFCSEFSNVLSYRCQHWRVNRLMRGKSTRISTWLLLWPSILLISTTLSILMFWTLGKEFGWERKEIDTITGESIGQCNGDIVPWLYVIMLLLAVPVILSGVMAYKALGIDDLYSEGKWVLTFILVQLQVSAHVLRASDRFSSFRG